MTMTITAPVLVRTEGWDCEDCAGHGSHAIWTCGHGGICPCAPDEPECRWCKGTGNEPCGHCGEETAEVEHSGTRYCMDCYEREV